MSSHDGVSCDACLKGNFPGKRYKCLVCYDYDLCAACYEVNATSTHHSLDHPMQCILTRADFDLFYGGEAFSLEQQLSYTCPLCGRLGFTDVLLHEHVSSEHPDASAEVVCPICACLTTGDPSHVVDDLSAHLLLEHRSSNEIDAQLGDIRAIRRMPHHARGMTATRSRRANMRFQSNGAATLPLLSPGSRDRELMDPIAELLSQLSSARGRVAAAQSISSQFHQLEIQLQSSRYGAMRQPQSDRLFPSLGETARTAATIPATFVRPSGTSQVPADILAPAAGNGGGNLAGSHGAGSSATGGSARSGFLLSRIRDDVSSEAEKQSTETGRADKSLFVQELVLALWTEEAAKDPEKTADASHGEPLAAPAAESPKLASLAPVRKEVAASPAAGVPISNGPPDVATRPPPPAEESRSAPASNGMTVAAGKFHPNRNSGKMRPVVGRPGREQTASSKH